MENAENMLQPGPVHAEPVLAVRDLAKTLAYWHDVLGFPDTWHWGEPAAHGGAAWHGTQIQFTLNPSLAAVSQGHSVWIRVRHVEQLYALHQAKQADIVSPLAQRPWGMAQYTVREINGYCIHFAAPVSARLKRSEALPPTLRIIPRAPTTEEMKLLTTAVGWPAINSAATYAVMLGTLAAAVVVEDTATGQVVGCALLTGNSANLYYVRDVIVHPRWQGQYVGTALMQALIHRADAILPADTMLTLLTSENLAPFYRQFDFTPTFSMIRTVRKSRQNRDDEAAD